MSSNFQNLRRIFKKLLSKNGCAWDRAQTHLSLLKYLKEETKEFSEAVRKNSTDEMKEELGDILLQVMFHAQIAQNQGRFDIEDVMEGLIKKLRRRHPHVFGKESSLYPNKIPHIINRWNEIKRKEKNHENLKRD